MTDEEKIARARRLLSGADDMSAERPLDALLPDLKRSRMLDIPKLPFHPRVLEVEMEDGIEWVMACFMDPGDQRSFHKQLLALLEATLMVELSQAPKRIAERDRPRHFSGIRLLVFPRLPYELGPAVQAFGFRKEEYRPDQFVARMAALQNEADMAGIEMPKSPSSIWFAPISRPVGPHSEKLFLVERNVALAMKTDVWGTEPGQLSRYFATFAAEEFGLDIRPNMQGLDALERLLTRREFGSIRWMPPLAFQALCDLIGVVAKFHFGSDVAWAVCEEDRSGLAPPPIFQVKQTETQKYHVPIAHHVLRWVMMPIGPRDEVPPLSAWMVDQFSRS